LDASSELALPCQIWLALMEAEFIRNRRAVNFGWQDYS